jgi:hypothetical protein
LKNKNNNKDVADLSTQISKHKKDDDKDNNNKKVIKVASVFGDDSDSDDKVNFK